jgi:predicted signal transduction protein with EAL and GGDEF domain
VLAQHRERGRCQLVAQRIIDTLNCADPAGGKELFTSASIGIADGRVALSQGRGTAARRRRRDVPRQERRPHRFAVFDERLHLEAMRLLDLEGDLRRAIARSEFVPFFQPILRLSDRRIVGYEACCAGAIRSAACSSRPISSVSPRTPACGTDRLEDLRARFRGHAGAADDGRRIHQRESFRPALPLRDARHEFLAMLRQHYVAPASIRIEVTERTLIENPPAVKRMLEGLRRDGLASAARRLSAPATRR